MKLIVMRPPMFDAIDKKFGVAGQKVIFCWGDTIYNPEGVFVTAELQAHEYVHSQRQAGHPEPWWLRYIDDAEFRLVEEIPAHQMEYRAYCDTHKDRNDIARYLHGVASRLSGPLYGGLISFPVARNLVMA